MGSSASHLEMTRRKDGKKCYLLSALKSCAFDPEHFEDDYEGSFAKLIEITANKRHWFECGEIPRREHEAWFLYTFRFGTEDMKLKKENASTADKKLTVFQ